MTRIPGTLLGLTILAVLLTVVGIVGARAGSGPSGGRPLQAFAVNKIAYVDRDGQIHLTDLGRTESHRISPDVGFYTWPTWSPDAKKLVFSGVAPGTAGDFRISLFHHDTTTGERRELHVGEKGVVGLLADRVVHYPQWSPDSRHVAFVAVSSFGLTLFLVDADGTGEPELLLDSGPVWSTWSPDSRFLLVHRDTDLFLVSGPEDPTVTRLETSASAYRVPAWDPGAGAITVVREDEDDERRLVIAEARGRELRTTRPLADVAEHPAFLWSPDGEYLALGASPEIFVFQSSILFSFRNLSLLPRHGRQEPLVIEGNVLAYFWAPNGKKLAYVTPSERGGSLRWMVLEVETGKRLPLVDFLPSRDQMTMLEFFDQYSYSHSVWSPDSRYLVFSGRVEEGETMASLVSQPASQGQYVLVVDTEANGFAIPIAEGTLGVWSPR